LRWRGETLLERAVRAVQRVCGGQAIVVVGAHRALMEPLLAPLGVRIVVSDGWREGVASSLRAGVAALPAGSAAALLTTCDQPHVSDDSLALLARAWRAAPERCVASAYAGTIGVPAIIPARLHTALAHLQGDRGARSLLLAEGDALVRVPVPDAAFDVDDETAARALEQDRHPPRR
jgi:molybdenum cofactor cytidylyltransferase